MRSHHLRLSDPFSDATGALDVDNAHTDSVRYWLARAGGSGSLALDSGPASMNGHLEGSLADRSVSGHLAVDVEGARLADAKRALRADGSVAAQVVFSASLRDKHVDLTGSRVELRDVHVEAHDLKLFAPKIVASATRTVVARAGVLGRVQLEAPDVRVLDLATFRSLVPLPAGVTIDGGSGVAQVKGDINLGDATVEGQASLHAGSLRAHVGAQVLSGDLRVLVQAARRRGITDVSGSRVTFRESTPDGWWARIDTSQALVDFNGKRLRAHLLASAKDASPIRALIDSHTGVAAQLALGVVPSSELRAAGDILVGPSLFEVRSATASASGFGVGLELANLGQARTVALDLVVGPVHAGIDVTPDGTRVVLFGADTWFAARVASLRAVERRYE